MAEGLTCRHGRNCSGIRTFNSAAGTTRRFVCFALPKGAEMATKVCGRAARPQRLSPARVCTRGPESRRRTRASQRIASQPAADARQYRPLRGVTAAREIPRRVGASDAEHHANGQHRTQLWCRGATCPASLRWRDGSRDQHRNAPLFAAGKSAQVFTRGGKRQGAKRHRARTLG
jgi:hypothetical protein